MYEFKNRKPDECIIYKTADGIKLPMNIYLPEGGVDTNTRCVVFIHGGAWTNAIKDNSEWDGDMLRFHAAYFAEKGCIGIAFSYRSLNAYEGLSVYDILDDCNDAMKYIRDNLKYVNYKDIIVVGESAGGHLAAMLGISQTDDIRPKAVVAINPVLDCTGKWSYGVAEDEDAYSVSPVFLMPEKCSDFLLLHGTKDTTTDIGDTQKFYENLIKLGHKAEFVKVKDAVHAFVLFDYQSTDEYAAYHTEQIFNYIQKKW